MPCLDEHLIKTAAQAVSSQHFIKSLIVMFFSSAISAIAGTLPAIRRKLVPQERVQVVARPFENVPLAHRRRREVCQLRP